METLNPCSPLVTKELEGGWSWIVHVGGQSSSSQPNGETPMPGVFSKNR